VPLLIEREEGVGDALQDAGDSSVYPLEFPAPGNKVGVGALELVVRHLQLDLRLLQLGRLLLELGRELLRLLGPRVRLPSRVA
jgi:hypothetical protein